MFFVKFYELVLSRLELLSSRLFVHQSTEHFHRLWNLFLFFFENYTETLFKSRDLDQIVLSIIYFYSNPPWTIEQVRIETRVSLCWSRLIQVYRTMPNSRLNVVRSVFIGQDNQQNRIIFQLDLNSASNNENPWLTPSKPAGTIHQIDDQLVGDITSFYKKVFLRLDKLNERLVSFFDNRPLRPIPERKKSLQRSTGEFHPVELNSTSSITFSSKRFDSNASCASRNLFDNKNSSQSTVNNEPNSISSSIQAGQQHAVQTTRTRTRDGKFLTTISTVQLNSSQNGDDVHSADTEPVNDEPNDLYRFGENKVPSNKRISSLESFKNKLLIIENDRINVERQST